jgi:hypothetical protein
MKLHHSITVKEELINFEVLTNLVNNYCLNGLKESVIPPIEHVFIEINVTSSGNDFSRPQAFNYGRSNSGR